MRTIKESVLFLTSSGSDVQCSNGRISITGLKGINKRDIISISQLKYKPQVLQVVTLGNTVYTPVSSKLYKIAVYDGLRSNGSYTETPKIYSVLTPPDVTTLGNAAAQREWIHADLVAQINLGSAQNKATAVSLGGGAGFTVTDSGPYYPVYGQNVANIKGVNRVYTIANADGSGFQGPTAALPYGNGTLTTAAQYSFGSGVNLALSKPVVSFVFGNLIGGVLEAPPVTSTNQPAVGGQNYDGFVISSLKLVEVIGIGSQFGYERRLSTIFVDNGTGGATTNLAGFSSFSRAMHHLLFDQYKSDPSSIIYLGDTGTVSQGLNTGLPSGVSLAENVINFGNGFSTHYYPLGASTLLAPTSTALGLGLVLDAATGEGMELSAPTWASSNKNFVVGKTAASIYCKINIDDVSGLNPMWVGFRLQEAANLVYTAYNSYAFIGLGNALGDIFTSVELANGGNTNVDTTNNWADTETHTLEVRVDIKGAVTFFLDGYKPIVTQAFSFTAGQVLIPVFGYALQTVDIGTPSLSEGVFINSDSWRF